MTLRFLFVLTLFWLAFSATARAAALDGRFILSTTYRGEEQLDVIEFFPDGKCVINDSIPGTFQTYPDGRLLFELSASAVAKKAKVYTHELSGAVLKLTASGASPDYYVKQPSAPHPTAADLIGKFSRHREKEDVHMDSVWDYKPDKTFQASARYLSIKTKDVLEFTMEGTWTYSHGIITATVLKSTDPRSRKVNQVKGVAVRRDSQGLWMIDSVTGEERVISPADSMKLPPLPPGFTAAE